MTLHIVKRGEYLSLIAQKYKIADWKTIYGHPKNAAFRSKRPNPDLIYPGDEIYVPDGRDGGAPSINPPAKPSAEPAANLRYMVPGYMPDLLQRTENGCWATAYTLMRTWKFQQSLSVEEALLRLGPDYLEKYQSDETLRPNEIGMFLFRARMQGEAATPFTAEGWSILFQKYGMLWVGGSNLDNTGYHSRIACGIWRSGGPETTIVRVNDPGYGQTYNQAFNYFLDSVLQGSKAETVVYPRIRHW